MKIYYGNSVNIVNSNNIANYLAVLLRAIPGSGGYYRNHETYLASNVNEFYINIQPWELT